MAYYAVTGTTKADLTDARITLSVGRVMEEFCQHADGIAFGGAQGIDSFTQEVVWVNFDEVDVVLLYPEGERFNERMLDLCTDKEGIQGGYMKRNDALVKYGVDGLIAFPRTHREELRSGTWATIRRARKAGVPVHIFPLTEG